MTSFFVALFFSLFLNHAETLSIINVDFKIEPIPPVNHSQANPGPKKPGVDRAGYVQARIQKRLGVAWDDGPQGKDGLMPFYFEAIDVFFTLKMELFVSSIYKEGSCPYEVTLEHERSHADAFASIFDTSREALLWDLEKVNLPTKENPLYIKAEEKESVVNSLSLPLRKAIKTHAERIQMDMEKDRNAKDVPEAYWKVHDRCSVKDWESATE